LLVDDDAGVRLAIREMLEEGGHPVVEAPGGVEALAVLRGDRGFDLLLIDFAMPLMNGGQLAAEITRMWPEAPILFVTGYVENDALRPWANRGYGTVQKPFGARDLPGAVERAMRQPVATPVKGMLPRLEIPPAGSGECPQLAASRLEGMPFRTPGAGRERTDVPYPTSVFPVCTRARI
jgi:CheY-like chemotaxis protein